VIVPHEPGDLDPSTLAAETQAVIRKAAEIADEMHHPLIGTEHLVVAVLEAADVKTRETLTSRGLTAAEVRVNVFGQRE